MQTVYLNGGIERFGHKWSTDCANIRDIFKLIECQTPGFRQYMLEAAENNVGFEIQRGSDLLDCPEELLLNLRNEDIVITEVPSGSKTGAGKIVAAIAIAALFMTPGFAPTIQMGSGVGGLSGALPTIEGGMFINASGALTISGNIAASLAVNLALTGVAQLLAPGPETETPAENEHYLFDGPENVAAQGLPVPVVYGELIVGGSPVSVAYRHNSRFRNKTFIEERHNPYVEPDTEGKQDIANATTTEPDGNDGSIIHSTNSKGIPIRTVPTTHPDPEWLDNKREQEASQFKQVDEYISEQVNLSFG